MSCSKPQTPNNSEYAWQFFPKYKMYPSNLQCPYSICHLKSYHPWQIADYIEKNSLDRYQPHYIPGNQIPPPVSDQQNKKCGHLPTLFYLHDTQQPPINSLGVPIDRLGTKPYYRL